MNRYGRFRQIMSHEFYVKIQSIDEVGSYWQPGSEYLLSGRARPTGAT